MPWLSQRANEWQILRVSLAVIVCVFIALPWAAASRSIKETAQMLVIKPAQATFTRPLGDMDALLEE